jgi:hypothetical protein
MLFFKIKIYLFIKKYYLKKFIKKKKKKTLFATFAKGIFGHLCCLFLGQ